MTQEQYDYEVQRQQWLEEQEANNVRCKCGNPINPNRIAAGYFICLECGEAKAKEARTSWCISIPYSKGAYQLITDTNDMKQTNPKRTHY